MQHLLFGMLFCCRGFESQIADRGSQDVQLWPLLLESHGGERLTIFSAITICHYAYTLQPEDPKFASQKLVYEQVGKDMLEHAFEGLV